MRELNEMELEQVAGGFSFWKGTTAEAQGGASAVFGAAGSSSHTSSVNVGCFSASSASNHSWGLGLGVSVGSEADSSAGVTASN